jgi:hypothetical protein
VVTGANGLAAAKRSRSQSGEIAAAGYRAFTETNMGSMRADRKILRGQARDDGCAAIAGVEDSRSIRLPPAHRLVQRRPPPGRSGRIARFRHDRTGRSFDR